MSWAHHHSPRAPNTSLLRPPEETTSPCRDRMKTWKALVRLAMFPQSAQSNPCGSRALYLMQGWLNFACAASCAHPSVRVVGGGASYIGWQTAGKRSVLHPALCCYGGVVSVCLRIRSGKLHPNTNSVGGSPLRSLPHTSLVIRQVAAGRGTRSPLWSTACHIPCYPCLPSVVCSCRGGAVALAPPATRHRWPAQGAERFVLQRDAQAGTVPRHRHTPSSCRRRS